MKTNDKEFIEALAIFADAVINLKKVSDKRVKVPKYDKGGVEHKDAPAIVGCSGKEVVVPSVSGYTKFSKGDAEKFMKGVNKKPLYSVVNFSTKDNCNAMPWD